MKKKLRTFWLIISLMFIFNMMSISIIYAQGSREYEIKAAFLYNFAKFVTWPDEAFADVQSPFVIGVLGQDPFDETLKSIEGKVAQDRKIIIKRFNSEKDIDICHILFISSSEKNRLNQIFNNGLSGKNILTIGDMTQFTQSGGIINFILQNNMIRFEISQKSVQRTGLSLSSQLLKLAIVKD